MMNFREVTAGGESDKIAPDPKDPEVIYGGRVEKLDLRTQQTADDRPDPRLPRGGPRAPGRCPSSSRAAIRASSTSRASGSSAPRTAASTGRRSAPTSRREDPGVPATLDPSTAADKPRAGRAPRRHLRHRAPRALADRDLWVGTDDGLVWRTRDEGAHWQNVTPAGARALVEGRDHRALALRRRDRLRRRRPPSPRRLPALRLPHARRRADLDGGRRRASPTAASSTPCARIPVRRGLLYAGTEKGVYVSFDDGDHWQPLQMNLPVTSVRDIDVHGDDVVIAHPRPRLLDPGRRDAAAPGRTRGGRGRDAASVRARDRGARAPRRLHGHAAAEGRADGREPAARARTSTTCSSGAATAPVDAPHPRRRGRRSCGRYSSDDRLPGTDLSKIRTAPEWATPPVAPLADARHAPVRLADALSGRRPPSPTATPTPTACGRRPAATRSSCTVGGAAPPAAADRRARPARRRWRPRPTRGSSRWPAASKPRRRAWPPPSPTPTPSRSAWAAGGSSPARTAVLALLGPEFGAAPAGPPPPGIVPLRVLAGQLSRFLEAVDGADAPPSPDVEAAFAKLEPVIAAAIAAAETAGAASSAPPR